MDQADEIPQNVPFAWSIAMTDISREKEGKFILCQDVKDSKELDMKIGKSVWEYQHAIGHGYGRDIQHNIREALDIDEKIVVMQKSVPPPPHSEVLAAQFMELCSTGFASNWRIEQFCSSDMCLQRALALRNILHWH